MSAALWTFAEAINRSNSVLSPSTPLSLSPPSLSLSPSLPFYSYTLMQSCWHSSPHQRPTAEDLVQLLSQTNLLCNEGETDGMSGSDSGTQLSIGLPTAAGAYPQETEV